MSLQETRCTNSVGVQWARQYYSNNCSNSFTIHSSNSPFAFFCIFCRKSSLTVAWEWNEFGNPVYKLGQCPMNMPIRVYATACTIAVTVQTRLLYSSRFSNNFLNFNLFFIHLGAWIIKNGCAVQTQRHLIDLGLYTDWVWSVCKLILKVAAKVTANFSDIKGGTDSNRFRFPYTNIHVHLRIDDEMWWKCDFCWVLCYMFFMSVFYVQFFAMFYVSYILQCTYYLNLNSHGGSELTRILANEVPKPKQFFKGMNVRLHLSDQGIY
jgi:hypothetical protein